MQRILDSLGGYRLTLAQGFWLGAACIVATMIVGFGIFGWVSGGKAVQMKDEAAASSRHALAMAICVDRFMHAENSGARLQKLKDAAWHERDKLIAASGWATMPDRKEPNDVVATMCASQLLEKASASK